MNNANKSLQCALFTASRIGVGMARLLAGRAAKGTTAVYVPSDRNDASSGSRRNGAGECGAINRRRIVMRTKDCIHSELVI